MGLIALPAVPPILAALGKAVAFVGSAAVAAYGANHVINEMSKAEEEAEEKPATGSATDACSSCPPPECRDLEDGMRRDAETIRRRINDMKDDTHKLYDNHYLESQAHPVYGSWKGHERQIKQVQKALNNKRAASERMGCPKPSSSILQWLRSNAPSAPRGR